MQKYQGESVTDKLGNAIPGATVTVRTSPGGVLATIYSDNGVTPLSNPLTTNADGEYSFYAANGRYDLTISATGYADDTLTDQLVWDPVDANLQTKLTAGANVTIAPDGTISASGASLSSIASTGITDSTTLGRSLITAGTAASARTALGLGTIATADATTYAPLASPAFTGTPTVPTAAAADNTSKAASTAFVQQEIAAKAPLASPAFTGTPTAPTATAGTNTTQVATTAFVGAAVSALSSIGYVTGIPTGNGIRRDAPFAGVPYESGVALSNNYNLTSVPSAASTYDGCVVWITDACTNGTVSWGAAFECMSYDGTNYFWVPVTRRWARYVNRTLATGLTGSTSFQAASSHTLPNRADFFPPLMDAEFMMHSFFASHAGAGTANQVIQAVGGGNIVMNQQITGANTSGAVRNIVRGSGTTGSQFSLPNAASSSGFAQTTGADLTFSITWANSAWQFGITLSNATDNVSIRQRDLILVYP